MTRTGTVEKQETGGVVLAPVGGGVVIGGGETSGKRRVGPKVMWPQDYEARQPADRR
jgi:hypothetical protein